MSNTDLKNTVPEAEENDDVILQGGEAAMQENDDGEQLSEQEKRALYYEACYLMSEARTVQELEKAEGMFAELGDFTDSEQRLENCREKKEELKVKKAQADERKAETDKIRRAEYDALRGEAKRIEKILKKRDGAKRYREIAQIFTDKYPDIEGAADYAREYIATADRLEAAYKKRRCFEKISCIIAVFVQIIAALLYINVFIRSGERFEPLVPLIICDCIMFAGFMIGYRCESDFGAAASLFAAIGLAAMFIATVILCIANKLALGFLGYIMLILLPIVIGAAVGLIGYIVWSRFAA